MDNDLAPEPPSLARSRSTAVRGAMAEWIVTILVMLFASASIGWSYVIPTGSMEDTLVIGDHIFVDKLAYADAGAFGKYLLPYETPRHGDVIAFHYPVDPSQMYVKRLIGAPGDRLKIVNQQVYLNGVPIREPYAHHRSGFFSAYRDNFPSSSVWLDVAHDPQRDRLLDAMLLHHVSNGEVVVPPGHYFAMGDNRDNSLDSRYWGFVPRANIIGKPVLVFWSYDAPTADLMPGSPADMGRHMLDLTQHFFTRTRWNRTLHVIRGYASEQH